MNEPHLKSRRIRMIAPAAQAFALAIAAAPLLATPPAAEPAAPKRDSATAPPIAAPLLEIRSVWTKTRGPDERIDNASDPATRGREQLGRLVYSRIDADFEEVTLHEAFRALRRELGLNLVTFELNPRGRSDRPGFDGGLVVNLSMKGVSGRTLLEALCAQAGKGVTWQLSGGLIEVGPKEHLARPDACETRVYETTDLALDPPDYKSEGIGKLGVQSYNRRDSDEITGELVRMIVSHCEPEAFEPPQPKFVEDTGGRRVPLEHSVPDGSTREPADRDADGKERTGRENPNTGATVNFDPKLAQIFVRGKWASVQAKDNNLAVHAPDFVHRTIGGYGTPIPPRAD
jgi:hypothetical protein